MSETILRPPFEGLAPRRVRRAFVAHTRLTKAGFGVVAVLLLLTLIAPLVAPYHPEKPDANATLQHPSFRHVFGTDASGMDVLSRVLWAPRLDITIALGATLLSIMIGVPLGVAAGYLGRGVGEVVVRVSDIVQCFPLFILAMALVAVTGQTTMNMIYTIAFLNAPIYLRLMRTQTLVVRRRTFVEALTTMGNSSLRTIARHVLPNSLTPMFIQASTTIGWSILIVAGLSFIGAGVRAPTAEWGSMISIGAPNIITGEWWPSVFPGAAIAIAVLGFALVGEGLRAVYDQRGS